MKRYQKRMLRGYSTLAGAVILVVALVVVGANVFGNPQKKLGNSNKPTATETVSNIPVVTPLPTADETTSGKPATPSNSPTKKPSTDPNTVNIKAVGDIMIKSDQLDAAKQGDTYDFNSCFDKIAPSLSGGDLVIANLETTLNGRTNPQYSGTEALMNTPASILEAMKNAGINMVVTANSRALDGGVAGVSNTIKEIKAAGLDYVGTYESQADYDKPFIKEINGIKIGIVAYTADTNDRYKTIPADKQQYITRYFNPQKVNKVINDIKALKSAGAEYVISYMHWGTEFSAAPSATQKTVAQDMLDNGVDMILASHTHSVQAITYKDVTVGGKTRKIIVAYALGNFLNDQSKSGNKQTNTGFMLDVTIKKDANGKITVTDSSVIPTWLYKNETGDKTTFEILPLGKYATQTSKPADISESAYADMKAEWDRVKKIKTNGVKFKNE